jgi:hypothetical protein
MMSLPGKRELGALLNRLIKAEGLESKLVKQVSAHPEVWRAGTPLQPQRDPWSRNWAWILATELGERYNGRQLKKINAEWKRRMQGRRL